MIRTLEVPTTTFPTQIEKIGSEIPVSSRNIITGLLRDEHRVLHPGIAPLTLPEIKQQFKDYELEARQNRASMFIASVRYSLLDDFEFGGFSQVSYDTAGRHARIEHLMVTSPARRAHVGRLLLASVIEEAQTRHAGYVQYGHIPQTPAEEKLLLSYDFTANAEGKPELRLGNLQ